MTLLAGILIFLALAMIVGGIIALKKSARKFNLTKQQLDDIKARNKALDKEQEKNDPY